MGSWFAREGKCEPPLMFSTKNMNFTDTVTDEQDGGSEALPMGVEPARWFAVRVKPGRDDMAVRGIVRLGLRIFQPFMRVELPGSASRRFRQEPLFRGYLFVRFQAEEWLEAVRFVPGVLYVVSSGRTPLAVEEDVIAELRSRLGPDGLFQLRRAKFAPDQAVTVQDGLFAGLVGRVEQEWDDGRRVAILLDALHQARVLVDADSLAVC